MQSGVELNGFPRSSIPKLSSLHTQNNICKGTAKVLYHSKMQTARFFF